MSRIRAIRLAEGEDAAHWAEAIADPLWERNATLLKDGGDVTVRRARLLGREVVVKRWTLASSRRRLQALLNRTPACRHWRGASLLLESGFHTATPHALLRGQAPDGRPAEWLVMAFLPGKTVLQHLADGHLTVRQEHALAQCLGRLVVDLRARHLGNRDHKPSNLLVRTLPETLPNAPRDAPDHHIAILDCGGVRPLAPGFTPDELFAMLIECVGTGLTPRRGVMMRVLRAALTGEEAQWARLDPSEWREDRRPARAERRDAIHAAWRRLRERVRVHGDPTPKVNPLVSSMDSK